MSSHKRSYWPSITIAIAVLALIVALPTSVKPWAPAFLKPDFHLGLDLAGGTQLDFRISENQIEKREESLKQEIAMMKGENQYELLRAKQAELRSLQEQRSNLVEAIRTVLERRMNSLGVSEAVITPSYYGSEKHLLVECPGVVDIERCKKTVGKTIQLEFKEEFSGPTDEYVRGAVMKADTIFKRVSQTGSLKTIGEEMGTQLGISYTDSQPFFENTLPPALKSLWKRKVGEKPIRVEGVTPTVVQDAQGNPQYKEIKGIFIAEVTENIKPAERVLSTPAEAFPELAKRTNGAVASQFSQVNISTVRQELQKDLLAMEIGSNAIVSISPQEAALIALQGRVDGANEMSVSHILVSYAGAERAEDSVTRSKEEAKQRAESLKARLNDGEQFSALASTESDGDSKKSAGSLGTIRAGTMPLAFEKAAFALKKGAVSDIVETPFGYHIIRADSDLRMTDAQVSYDLLTLKAPNANETLKKMEEQMTKGDVKVTADQIGVRVLFVSLEPTGWKDTALNGERFRSAGVVMDPTTNLPLVQIQFDQEGGKMFQEMTKRNVGKRIAIFVGGDLVSAPVVRTEIIGGTAVIDGSRSFDEARTLAMDLNTGAIPAPIFLSGQTTIEATLGSTALQESVRAAIVGFLILSLFLILIYRLLGVMAVLALLLYVVLLVASMKLPIGLFSGEYVVLTLAGIAGIILSVGMAVDANVLAFERLREEIQKGKSFKSAIDTGFKRAWPSVRDGNVSTLITCSILFLIGTSIIRGFAVTLSIGIFLSLFTAIVVSRWLCRRLAASVFGSSAALTGAGREDTTHTR